MLMFALTLSAAAILGLPATDFPTHPAASPQPPPILRQSTTLPPPVLREFTPEQRAEWKRRADRAVACRRAFVGQDYMPQPGIWKLSDADTTLYLFGTIHQLPISFDWRSAQMDRIIDEAGSLITETGLRGDGGGFNGPEEWLKKYGGNSRPIARRVRGERRAKWLGMSAMMPETVRSRLNRMPSWLAAIMISGAASAQEAPTMGPGVDSQLKQTFKNAKKPIAAIEDGDAVATDVSRMPQKDQRRMLNEALDHVGHRHALADRMKGFHQWAKGEQSSDPAWTKANGASDAMVFMRERLLDTRNTAWAETLGRRMSEPGVVLVAVGAGHLTGKGSLLELLAARGLTAERVSPTAPPRPRPAFLPKPSAMADCNRYQFGDLVPPAL